MKAMRRIVIVGCGGSGKSTLAQQLGAILNLKLFTWMRFIGNLIGSKHPKANGKKPSNYF